MNRRPPAPSACSLLLLRRRWLADRALATLVLVLTAVSAGLAFAIPRLVSDTFDRGVADAVRRAGTSAEILGHDSLAHRARSATPDRDGRELRAVTSQLTDHVGRALGGVTGPALVSAVSATYGNDTLLAGAPTRPVGGPGRPGGGPGRPGGGPGRPGGAAATRLLLRFGYAWSPDGQVRYVEGRSPDAVPGSASITGHDRALAVALSTDVAKTLGVATGDTFRVADGGRQVGVRVVGVFAPAHPEATLWQRVPGLTTPAVSVLGTSVVALLGERQLGLAQSVLSPVAFSVTFDLPVRAGAISSSQLGSLRAQLSALVSNPSAVTPDAEVTPSLTTGLGDVLLDEQHQQQAVAAELSLVLAGVVAAAAGVVALGAVVLVDRRRAGLAVERARGAGAIAVGLRLAVESVAGVGVAATLGVLVARALTPDRPASLAPLALLVAVAMLALPLRASVVTARCWQPPRAPRGRRRANPRRLVLEGLVLLLAATLLMSTRSHGLRATPSGGVDLVLSLEPVLAAAALTVVSVRVMPLVLRLVLSLAARRRGFVGIVGAARAMDTTTGSTGRQTGGRATLASLVLTLALTVSLALTTCAGILHATVDDGQRDASWLRVGAWARVSASTPFPATALSAARSAAGVRHLSAGMLVPSLTMRIGHRYTTVNLLVVDSVQYRAVLADTPLASSGRWDSLTGAGLPLLAGGGLAATIGSQDIGFVLNDNPVTARLAGPLPASFQGWLPGPTMLGDVKTLGHQLDSLDPQGVAVLSGPGAAAAAESLASSVPGAEAVSRASWLAETRGSALIGGTGDLFRLATIVLAAYALLALLLVVSAGSAERGRTLSYLRTLGATGRDSRRIAWLELAPLVLGPSLFGILGGVGVTYLLRPALGLANLTHGLADPPITASPLLVGELVAGVAGALILTTVFDVAVSRRLRLARVLRLEGTG